MPAPPSSHVLASVWFPMILYFRHWGDDSLSPFFPVWRGHSTLLRRLYGNYPCLGLREAWPFLWHLIWVGRQTGIWPTATLDVAPTSRASVLVTQTIPEFPREEKLVRLWNSPPRGICPEHSVASLILKEKKRTHFCVLQVLSVLSPCYIWKLCIRPKGHDNIWGWGLFWL